MLIFINISRNSAFFRLRWAYNAIFPVNVKSQQLLAADKISCSAELIFYNLGPVLLHFSLCHHGSKLKERLVCCFGFNAPLRQYLSLSGRLPEREKEKRKDRREKRKNVQIIPTRTYYKCNRPLPYNYPNQ